MGKRVGSPRAAPRKLLNKFVASLDEWLPTSCADRRRQLNFFSETARLPARQMLGFRGGISDDMVLRTSGRFHLDLFGG